MKKLSKNITYWLGVTAVGLVVGLSLQFVRAWTEPSVAPPGGNVGAPLNTSNIGQSKGGMLLVNSNSIYQYGLIVTGRVGIGTAAPTNNLDINGGLRVRTLTTCSNATTGKLYADASGNVLCGTDQSSAGGGLTGSGTTNYVSKWTGATSLGNSQIYDNGSNVGIGTAGPTKPLTVYGNGEQLRLSQNDSNGWLLWGGGNLHFRTIDGTDRVFFGSNGNVGIGTASPTQKLEVAGKAKIGKLYLSDNSTGYTAPGFATDGTNVGALTNGSFQVVNSSASAYQNVYANDYYIGAIGKWASTLGGGTLSCITKTGSFGYYPSTVTCDTGYTLTGCNAYNYRPGVTNVINGVSSWITGNGCTTGSYDNEAYGDYIIQARCCKL